MAKNEYVGKRVTATLPEDVYNALLEDAELNGMKYSSRATQILTLFFKGKLALVDTLGVAPVGAITNTFTIDKTVAATSSTTPNEVKSVEDPSTNLSKDTEIENEEDSKLGKAKTKANKGKFGKKS